MNYYNEINRKIKNYQVNKSDLDTYYNVGKLLSEAGKHYGEGIIKEYSKRLTIELGKEYDISALKRMRKFYYLIQKGATLSHFLSKSHYVELLSHDDTDKINYYVDITEKDNLSIRKLYQENIC